MHRWSIAPLVISLVAGCSDLPDTVASPDGGHALNGSGSGTGGGSTGDPNVGNGGSDVGSGGSAIGSGGSDLDQADRPVLAPAARRVVALLQAPAAMEAQRAPAER